jgi:hypothetical protein
MFAGGRTAARDPLLGGDLPDGKGVAFQTGFAGMTVSWTNGLTVRA